MPFVLQLKLQGEKSGRKGHLSVATEVSTPSILPLRLIRILNQSGTWINTVTCSLTLLWMLTFFFFQIFEVAPSLYMVEVRKAGGDTLEFHKASNKL